MIILDSILESFIENLDDLLTDKGNSIIIKTLVAIIFIFFYLFISIGFISFGINYNYGLFKVFFVLLGLTLLIYQIIKIILIFNKKKEKNK